MCGEYHYNADFRLFLLSSVRHHYADGQHLTTPRRHRPWRGGERIRTIIVTWFQPIGAPNTALLIRAEDGHGLLAKLWHRSYGVSTEQQTRPTGSRLVRCFAAQTTAQARGA